MNPHLVLVACVTVGTFIAGANLAWQHVQHQELLPDGRTASHDLRTLRLRHLGAAVLGRRGATVGADGEEEDGVLSEPAPAGARDYDAGDPRRLTYHVVISSDGSVYNQWQSRICYWHIQKLKAEEPRSAMGGFTRLLHSGKPDGLMNEMPTVVVQPLPAGTDQGYRVLHRPWAFVQWLPYAAKLPEDYVLMAEPDHIFLHIPPLWATPDRPAAFPFSYMDPSKYIDVISRYNERNVSIEQFAPIGNSPVQIHQEQLAELVPLWYDLALKFHKDAAASKAFGWIQEMYAWSVASAQSERGPLDYQLKEEFMLQPPFDMALDRYGTEAFIMHYTYGQDLSEDGAFTPGVRGFWHWDKREYEAAYPPRDIPLPRKCLGAAIPTLIEAINNASAAIEPWSFQAAPAT